MGHGWMVRLCGRDRLARGGLARDRGRIVVTLAFAFAWPCGFIPLPHERQVSRGDQTGDTKRTKGSSRG